MLISTRQSPYFGCEKVQPAQNVEPERVSIRTHRENQIKKTLLSHEIPQKLKSLGWVLWRVESTEKLDLTFVLDQVGNDSIPKIAQNTETLERLKHWLKEHRHTEKLESLIEAIAEGGHKVRQWLQRHTKRTHIPNQPDIFVLEEKKKFSEVLETQLKQKEAMLKSFFAEALKEEGISSEKITLIPRLKDTCCGIGCENCLNADPKSHKLFIKA